MPFDLALLAPLEDRHGGQLGAVVRDAGRGFAAPGDDGIEFAGDPDAGQGSIRHQGQALAGEVIDHGQDAKAPPVGESVGDEVQRPALIGSRGQNQGPSCPQGPFATAPAFHLELLLAIEAAELLVVHLDTFSFK